MKETSIRKNYKRLLAFILMFAVLLGQFMPFIPGQTAYAAQQNSYHDPAEHWTTSSNRTNELDANAVTSQETFLCYNCGKATQFTVWRTPEYTRDGNSDLTRNVKYSDGIMVDGVTKGNVNGGKPGVNAYYTQHHWTKAACSQCGNFNSQMDRSEYCFNKNVYWLYDCAAEFMQNLDEKVSYEYADRQYHKETREGGKYCAFCYGTIHNQSSRLIPHNLAKEVLPQLANQRFAIVSHCTDCDFVKTEYIAAKVVVASYYGVVDGQPHTITVSDLSESGVRASIRYGTSANNCNLTSAPNFTDEGQYTVYYSVTYKYNSTEMTEDGVAYVWLHDEREPDGGCTCGCGDPNCDCKKPNCNGGCCNTGCGDNHKFSLIESIKPTCLALGYDRYLCVNCGKIEKRDYVDSLGHSIQQIVIREATCEVDGKVLNICSRCGLTEVEYTPKGEHKYGTFNVAPTCTSPGYTVKECSVCGDRHITAMTEALPHNYEAHSVLPTCTTGGQTTYICEGCGSSFIGDHTEPLGHAWNEGEYIVEPTCAEDGIIEYTCTRCGATKREVEQSGLHSTCAGTINNAHKAAMNTVLTTSQVKAPMLQATNTVLNKATDTMATTAASKAGGGHIAGSPATCLNPQTCVVCGAVLAEATGHRYWQETTTPTCTEMGFTTYTCINCNQSYKSDYLNALGHNYSEQVTAPSCTGQGYTTYTCRKCGDSYVGNYREMTDHVWDSGTEKVNATCNGAGITEYHCKRCDAVRLETANATGHTAGAAATCTEPQLCSKCGAILQNAKGHRLEEKVCAPTCTNIGYTTISCKDCGLSYKTDYTDHLGHSYEKKVTAPTCLTEGYTTYTCTRCGDNYTSDYTKPVGHKWDNGRLVVSATCGGAGVTEYHCANANCEATRLENEAAAGHTPGKAATCTEAQICTDCGAVLQQALGHSFKEEVTSANCMDMGFTTVSCQNDGCGYTYKTDYTKPLRHNYLPEVMAATCTEGGYTTFTCERCSDSYVGDYTEGTGHKWDAGKTVVNSVCNGDGMTEYSCENCNEVRLEAQSALGHTPGENANCLEPQVCTKCGAILNKATGHNFKEEVTPATCLDMGYTTFSCENCDFSYKTDYAKPLGHNYQAEVTAPTCLEKGFTTYTCQNEGCEDSYVADYTEPTGHKWDAGKVVTESVCNGEGMTEYRCESCGLHRLEAKSALGHTPGAAASCTEPQVCTRCNAILKAATGHDYVSKVTAPSCEEMGYTTFTCKYCEDSYKGDYLDAVGHSSGEWVVDKQPTLTAEGAKHKNCTKCGKVLETEVIERVYNQSVTDGKGEAIVGQYLVTVTDTESKNPISGAIVNLNTDSSISVNLPGNRLLDYAAQTTVKVQLKAENSQNWQNVSAMAVSVTDVNKNYSAGKTDANGQIIVPNISGNTNADGVVTVGRTDDGVKQTLTVKVFKDGTKRPVKDAAVDTGKGGNVNVQLPKGVDMDEDNRIGILVSDYKQQSQKKVNVYVKGDLKQKAEGETDKDGEIILPETPATAERHSAYIVGYTDGTFRPEAQMTRAEAAAIFARLLAEQKNEHISPAKYTNYADTTVSDWYADYVNYLTGYGVIVGERSTFRPNEDISRAELTAMAVRFFEVTGKEIDNADTNKKTNNTSFNDVSNSYWAAEYIENAALYGWVQGYGNGSFKAESKITRAEAVTLINNLLGRVADSEYISNNGRRLNTFSDVYAKHWAYAAILEAANSHNAVVDKEKAVESWNR